MELEELKNIWQQYDAKLDKLEKLNKKLIMETIAEKTQKRINWYKFWDVYGAIIGPVIFIIVFHPYFSRDYFDWHVILGSSIFLSFTFFLSYINIKSFLIIKDIDLSRDTIINSAKKISNYKKLFNYRYKYAYLFVIIMGAAVILIIWKNLVLNTKTIVFYIVLTVILIYLNKRSYSRQLNKIAKLEKEMEELEEYSK
jgi:hypothetical protein